MAILRHLFRLFDLVKSETSPVYISAGIVLGMWLGLTSVSTLQWFLLFFTAILVRTNLVALLFSVFLFGVSAEFFYPLFNMMGDRVLLSAARLHPLWAWLYHAPIIPFTRFTDTTVMGSGIFCTLASVPVFLAFYFFLSRRWEYLKAAAVYSQLWAAWTSSRLYQRYMRFNEQKSRS